MRVSPPFLSFPDICHMVVQNAKASDAYVELSPGKRELLKRRVDLAARCVMKQEQDACAEVELLPQLDDVSDGMSPKDVRTCNATVFVLCQVECWNSA